MPMSLPNLRVPPSAFLDYDLTYLTLLHHFCLYIGTNALTWNLYKDPGNSDPAIEGTSPAPPSPRKNERTHGISHKMLIFYALAFSARMVEYLMPLNDFTYDFAACTGFTALYWLGIITWMVYSGRSKSSIAQARMELNGTIFVTGALAFFFNYNHLELTPSLFCWAWSHYLEGVAMLPQFWTMTCLNKEKLPISTSVWVGVHMTALARIFQILNWTYLFLDAEIMDHLQVVAAAFYVMSYLLFLAIILLQSVTVKITHDEDKLKKKSD